MNESVEMYLETILILTKSLEKIKAIDIAKKLNYSKPSVSNALVNLTEKGLVNIIDKNIYLTQKGMETASYVYEKHNVITSYLVESLNLEKEEAEINACKIEHVITDKCFNKMKEYVKWK